MTAPTININGTSPERLAEQYGTAKIAVLKALDALGASEPHGRDYYHTPGALAQAQREHLSRLARLEAVQRELSALEIHCYDRVPHDARPCS